VATPLICGLGSVVVVVTDLFELLVDACEPLTVVVLVDPITEVELVLDGTVVDGRVVVVGSTSV
jgi:hypothetical protein